MTNSIDGAINKVPLAGGTPTTLAGQQNCAQGIAIDADTVYWTTQSSVLKVSKAGGTVGVVAASETNPVACTGSA